MNPDEEVPVRSFTDYGQMTEDDKFSIDEGQQSTLVRVHDLLQDKIKEIKSFDLFDLVETELKLKQQIKVHRMVYDILEPLRETIAQTIESIDDKFKQRNNK